MLFIDTGSADEVQEIAGWGALSGATTNPTLLSGESADLGATIRQICELIDGPVSAEVVSEDPDEMVAQGQRLNAIHENVVVKLPFGPAGLAATQELVQAGVRVNMTLVFTPAQALLAAEAGVRYVSCFIGRLEDIGEDALGALDDVIAALRHGDRRPLVLAASIRTPRHAVEAAKLGADIATIPAKVCARCPGIRSPNRASSVFTRTGRPTRTRPVAPRPWRRSRGRLRLPG